MRSFSVGDRIQFTAPANDFRVANRELGIIQSIGADRRFALCRPAVRLPAGCSARSAPVRSWRGTSVLMRCSSLRH